VPSGSEGVLDGVEHAHAGLQVGLFDGAQDLSGGVVNDGCQRVWLLKPGGGVGKDGQPVRTSPRSSPQRDRSSQERL
jgi:hypothetical protein